MILRRPMHFRCLLGAALVMGGASLAATRSGQATELAATGGQRQVALACDKADLSVLTYNVAGLPWPLAKKDAADLRAIRYRYSGT